MEKYLFSLLVSVLSLSAWAQGEWKGKIVDEKGEPVAYATVALLSKADSTVLCGVTAGEDGSFSIVSTDTDGILMVSMLGYQTRYLAPMDGTVITLREDTALLKGAVVAAVLPKTRLTGNSMVTNIAGSVLGKSGSLLEMLGKVPGLMMRGNEIEVIGKGKPLFYVDGRQLRDEDELKRLRSEEIKEVEVITSPGAQYDATVSSVVRIKTIRRQGLGFGFDAESTWSQDLVDGTSSPGSTVNLRYRHNDVDVFGMVNYWDGREINHAAPSQWTYIRKDGELTTIHQQMSVLGDWHGQGLKYNLGFNWQVAENHSVGLRIERHDNLKTTNYKNPVTDLTMEPQGIVEHTENRSHSDVSQPYHWEGNAYYSGKVGKLGIDLNVDFLTDKSGNDERIEEIRNGVRKNISSESGTSNRLLADKLVLSYPVWTGQIQAGTEMSFVRRRNYYRISGFPLPGTDSEVLEQNFAGFFEYNCEIPAVGHVNAGLRYEHDGFDYIDKTGGDGSMARYSDDFFPSVSWSREIGPLQASMSYGYKTRRPNYSMLNEAKVYFNAYSMEQGDPTLKNAHYHEADASLRWEWLNLYAAYERQDNALTQWAYPYDDEGMIVLKNINLQEPMRNVAVFLSAWPTWGVFSPNWTLGVQKFFDKYALPDPREASGSREAVYTKPVFFLDLNNTFRFKHSWQVEGNLNIMTKGDMMNFRMLTNSYNLGFAVQKCWLENDALCLRITLTDVLQRSSQAMEMDCGYYLMEQHNHFNRFRLGASLRYSFNASKSKYKGTGAGQSQKERM